MLYADAALTGSVVYPLLFAALAASGLAALFDYGRLSGGLFVAAGLLALVQAFLLALGGGSLLLTVELGALGFVGIVGGFRRMKELGDEAEFGDDEQGDEGKREAE
ncbi:hypothetical protein GCM10009039_01730 [Halocalculus aciditolerans]|uniref:Uncharacterized protein n=1 Tax=Halocalculus aciditolerans TaxID=1383812 RepID=A0A830FH92_9EURY|nr:hypothetical protein GCM10009039_01730 [Halocalculus aciditolerans]